MAISRKLACLTLMPTPVTLRASAGGRISPLNFELVSELCLGELAENVMAYAGQALTAVEFGRRQAA